MVATLDSGIKGTGRRNHSMTFFRVERVVVAVSNVLIITINMMRQPNIAPEYKPSFVGLGNGTSLSNGLPGILKAWTTITRQIKKRKYLISYKNLFAGMADLNNAAANITVKSNKSNTRDVAQDAMLRRIIQSSFIRPSIRWISELPGI
jgi:hypothetical protein